MHMSGEGLARSCTKNFPKEFRAHTVITQSTYPNYGRRSPDSGGHTYQMKVRGQDFTVDNKFVVPYNPLLSLKYKHPHQCRGCVCSVKVVKYLYKYITKGSDRVMVRLGNGEEVDYKRRGRTVCKCLVMSARLPPIGEYTNSRSIIAIHL